MILFLNHPLILEQMERIQIQDFEVLSKLNWSKAHADQFSNLN